jgi:hypothetical protein
MSRTTSIALPAALGFFSSLMVIIFDAWVRQRFGTDLMQFWVNLIIPIGALGLGMLASSGFVAGARISNFPAKTTLLVTMLASAAASFVMLHIIRYFTDTIGGIPMQNLIGLGSYLSDSLTHGSIKLSHDSSAEAFDLGKGGFVLPLGEFAGFIGGMAVGFFTLRKMPHCKKCRNYFDTVTSRSLKFRDTESFEHFFQSLPQESFARLGCLNRFETGYSPAISKKGMWTFSFKHKRCSSCQDQFVTESGCVYDGNNFQTLPFLAVSYFLTQSSSPPTPAVSTQSVRQFGRRAI